MSPLDIQRLSAITQAPAMGAGGKPDGGKAETVPAQDRSSAAPRQGVSVELRGEVASGQPPVDTNRVAEIRDALKEGRYPIVPSQIADALIAARLMLGYAK